MSASAQFLPLPQPGDLAEREKEDAMGAYLMMFAAWGAGLPLPLLNVIAAIVYFFVNRHKGPYVLFHCHQAMSTQVATGLVNAAAIFWTVRILFWEDWHVQRHYVAFLITAAIINVFYLGYSILAAVRARRGQVFYFPFFGLLAYRAAFAVRDASAQAPVNRPPV